MDHPDTAQLRKIDRLLFDAGVPEGERRHPAHAIARLIKVREACDHRAAFLALLGAGHTAEAADARARCALKYLAAYPGEREDNA